MNSNNFWKFSLLIGLVLSFVAFILGWIGFGVPDWHEFQHVQGGIVQYYGLWAYCQQQVATVGSVCGRWSTVETLLFGGSRPSFVRQSEGLITVGMILLSLALMVAVFGLVLPLIASVAGAVAIVSFIFLVIGVPIFGVNSDNLSLTRGDIFYDKRYGFWLMVPTIVLEFLAGLFFILTAILYKKFGYGNFGTGSGSHWPDNRNIPRPVDPMSQYPPGYQPPMLRQPYGINPNQQTEPTLLSQYLNQRTPYPVEVLARAPATAPPPSIIHAITPVSGSNGLPANYRFGEPVGPRFTPIINLSGKTIVGPLIRTR